MDDKAPKRKGSIIDKFFRLNQSNPEQEEKKEAELYLSAKLNRAEAVSNSDIGTSATHKPKVSVLSAAIDSVLDAPKNAQTTEDEVQQDLREKMNRIDKLKPQGASTHHHITRGAIVTASIGTKSLKSQDSLKSHDSFEEDDQYDLKLDRIQNIKSAKGAAIPKRSATHHGAILSEAIKRG